MNDKPTPIEVKLLRAEKRGRKIILVIESDLYSDETFAVTPFYDEGDIKNQLDSIHFSISVTEKSGEVQAGVSFGNCLSHFTKGHSQLHSPVNTFFRSKEDCVINWAMTAKKESLDEGKINQVLKMWDTEMQDRIKSILSKREQCFKIEKLKKAKENYNAALKKLEEAMEI